MHAAVLHTHGQAPSYRDYPDPQAADGHSLVRVTAAPVVPLDLLCASGTSYFGPPAVPYVPGVQGVGIVEQSDSLAVGTRVWFAASAGMAPGDGTLAELAAVKADDLVPIEAVEDDLLAALGLSAVAAWMSLTWRARLQPGERVLVLGGGGVVGQAAIGAARVLGAGRIVAACRSEAAAGRARAAGADEVVITPLDPAGHLELLQGACTEPVDVVIDPVFGSVAAAASQVLAPGGRLVNLGGSASDEAVFSSALVRSRSIEILGYTNNSLTVEQRLTAITAICQHAADGALSVAHDVRPLAEIEEVWAQQAAGAAGGRYVLRP